MAFASEGIRTPLIARAFRIIGAARPARKAARNHYDPRISEGEINRRALDKVIMQSICARSFA